MREKKTELNRLDAEAAVWRLFLRAYLLSTKQQPQKITVFQANQRKSTFIFVQSLLTEDTQKKNLPFLLI